MFNLFLSDIAATTVYLVALLWYWIGFLRIVKETSGFSGPGARDEWSEGEKEEFKRLSQQR